MQLLHHLWVEWVADNPFLRFELRRWCRSRRAWTALLSSIVMPLVALLLLIGFLPTFQHQPHGRSWGFLLTAFVTMALFTHLTSVVSAAGTIFSLPREAAAERLPFLRLLPLGGRVLMARIAVARALIAVTIAVAGIPIALAFVLYGALDPLDVAGLSLVLFALTLSPPGPAEIRLALAAQVGPDPNAARQKPQSWFFWIWVVLQFGGRSLGPSLGPLLMPFLDVLSRLYRSLGSPSPWILFSHGGPPGILRAVITPHAFFGWPIAPLWLLAAIWLAGRAARLVSAAEHWTREPTLRTLPGGRSMAWLPPSTGRPAEQRTAERCSTLCTALVFLALAGFSWHSLVLTGAAGTLSGANTPAGAAATLLALVGGLGVLTAFERLRLGTYATGPAGQTPFRAAAASVAGHLGMTAGPLLAGCLATGVPIWPRPALMLVCLAACAGSALVFALGWQALFHRQAAGEDPLAPLPWPTRVVAGILWVAMYVAPLIVLAMPGIGPIWHVMAALGPLYALGSLLPGLWPAPPPMPFLAALALSALAGAVALRARPARTTAPDAAPSATVAPPKPRSLDAIDACFLRTAERCDNPVLLLEVRRLVRQPIAQGMRFFIAFTIAVAVSAGMLFAFGSAPHGSVPFSVAGFLNLLAQPVRAGGMPLGAILGIAGCIGVLVLATLGGGLFVMAGVSEERTQAARQKRLPFLLVTALDDGQIVLGTLAARGLRASPAFAAGAGVSLMWCLFGLSYGAPWWLPLLWVWLLPFTAAMALHGALAVFLEWSGSWIWEWVWVLGMVWLVGTSVFWVVTGSPARSLWVAPGLLFLLSATLPLALRAATAAVRAHRTRDDLG